MREPTLFVAKYMAAPAHGAGSDDTTLGAYVNVWVDAPNEQEALAISEREVRSAGWSIEKLESIYSVSRKDLRNSQSGLEHFEQALLDGVVLVFHTWQTDVLH